MDKIQPGVVIGADGFSYERIEHSFKLERFPHIGGVKIGDNVEVSSNCSIARGSLSDTIIGDGTKLDALVHVAHNVEIGRNCILTAGTIVGAAQKLVISVGAYYQLKVIECKNYTRKSKRIGITI